MILAGSGLFIALFSHCSQPEKTSVPATRNVNSGKTENGALEPTTKPAPTGSPRTDAKTGANETTDIEAISKLATSEADLIKIYGSQNVRSKDIHLGEGVVEPGTVIFPDESNKTAEFLWKNAARKQGLRRIRISGQKSTWKVGPGITLGTSLKEVEKINGKPFLLAGFGWDYAGTVMSWENGGLEKEFTANGRVILRLEKSAEEISKIVSSEETKSVMGDQSFRSDNEVMRKINPQVYEIIIERK